MASRLIVALDSDRLGAALAIVRKLFPLCSTFKIGHQLFTAEGPEAVCEVAGLGANIFLDLKYHDIPNTLAGAIAAAARLPGVCLTNLHALGGLAMMRTAARALRAAIPKKERRPELLAVTLLTSMDAAAMHAVGIPGAIRTRAVRLARLAKQAGLDGVVTSAHEVRSIRAACGRRFIILVPGVRPDAGEKKKDDHARSATPAEAMQAGADYIVVGRPITGAKDPRAAAQAILAEMRRAASRRV